MLASLQSLDYARCWHGFFVHFVSRSFQNLHYVQISFKSVFRCGYIGGIYLNNYTRFLN
jgi:hypothetical protein